MVCAHKLRVGDDKTMSKRDFYKVLQVARDAKQDVIKRAYRKLALAYHPDRNPNDPTAETLFKEAAEAYEVLSAPEQRKRYDRFGHEGLSGGRYATGAGFSSVEDIFAQFGDIFGDIFGFGAPEQPQGPQRGHDVRYTLNLDFEEAVFGTNKSFVLTRRTACLSCFATGAAPDASTVACHTCDGTGQITVQQGFFSISSTCPDCDGLGNVTSTPCPDCDGHGQKVEARKVTVRIPAGVDHGTRLRVRQEGELGVDGGAPGDLIVTLEVLPSALFERDGLDLHHTTTLSFVQAALGTSLSIPTLGGEPTSLVIAAGAQHGDVFTIKDQGIMHVSGRKKGDLIVHLKLTTPTGLDNIAKDLLQQLADHVANTAQVQDPSCASSKNAEMNVTETTS